MILIEWSICLGCYAMNNDERKVYAMNDLHHVAVITSCLTHPISIDVSNTNFVSFSVRKEIGIFHMDEIKK